MPRKITPLTDTQVKSSKHDPAKSETLLSDGNGLYLRILPIGSKHWILRYIKPTTGKPSRYPIGKYPEVGLAKARDLTREVHTLLAEGIDPLEYREQAKFNAVEEQRNTVEAIFEHWFRIKASKVEFVTQEHIRGRFNNHLKAHLGKLPITALTRQMVLKLLRPIEEHDKLETVKRLCSDLTQLADYAANAGYLPSNPLTGISKAFKAPKVTNQPTLPPEQLPRLMAVLSEKHCMSRDLLDLQLLLLVRPGEMARMEWSELDLDAGLWVIPAHKIKTRRDFRVPLPRQAMDIISRRQKTHGHRRYVFPNQRNPRSHASTQTANQALKRWGFKDELVAHGLRALASTTLNEQGFDPDVIETALSHLIDNEVRRAYNRAEYLEQRKMMLRWWANHIDRARLGEFELTGTGHLGAA